MTILASHVPTISRAWLASHGVRIGAIAVTALVILGIARLAVRRMQRRLRDADRGERDLDVRRVATLTQAVSYVVSITVWSLSILLVLGEFGLNLAPLIAGAGVAGVALGFGAQSLVKDFFSGFFILLEDQFGVGDEVVVSVGGQPIAGTVEVISLRTTVVRDEQQSVHIIPNGNITVVANRSRQTA
ncbi:MAG TPA: mechanosensitive ion channel domain-containing protein [Actinomycetota bacterium]|nr:mechanosensitive ion channel domain-containing protein [Actinomycetota bacterium]